MEFKTVYSQRERFYTQPGEGVRKTFKPELDKNGTLTLVESGVEDVYSKIQSFKDSVDINVILERFAHGDTYALQQSEAFYGDFVSVPSSYMEALNAAVDLRNLYESSDGIDRTKISFNDFVESVLNPVSNAIADVVKKEQVANEVKEEDKNE